MSEIYRVVCTQLLYPADHRHIIGIGTGEEIGKPTRFWTVHEAWAAMLDNKDWFITRGGGNGAIVRRYDCECGLKTLRSAADATPLNNLDNLPSCG